ncbi:hypothetical protein Syun_025631 [Stephania yunnanensis]|uniref:Uncharacterized protein n=1 Tax=Stephania yunnanensis TaxID=152371 RepID=A0AAP0ES10_9MAGN
MLNLMTSPSNSMVRDPSSTSIFFFTVFKNTRPSSTDEAFGKGSSIISTMYKSSGNTNFFTHTRTSSRTSMCLTTKWSTNHMTIPFSSNGLNSMSLKLTMA